MMNGRFKYQILCTLILMFTKNLMGQKAQEGKIWEKMLAVCSGYQRQPFLLEGELNRRTAYVEYPTDTFGYQVVMISKPGYAYVQYDQVEIITQDSVSLIVLKDAKRMIVSKKRQIPVPEGPVNWLKPELKDHMMEKYNISDSADKNGGVFSLKSKEKIPGSDIPSEIISIFYDAKRAVPTMIQFKKNRLLNKYSFGHENVAEADKLDSVRINGFACWINPSVDTYKIHQLVQGADVKEQVLLSDRLTMNNKSGSYKPVEGYGDYLLRIQ